VIAEQGVLVRASELRLHLYAPVAVGAAAAPAGHPRSLAGYRAGGTLGLLPVRTPLDSLEVGRALVGILRGCRVRGSCRSQI